MAGAIEPVPVADHRPTGRFTRGHGAHPPVPWFAIRWLSKNLGHLVASYAASDDIDSRDWMRPDPPEELLDRVAVLLGADGDGDTLCARLGRDLWIDYVADTGDDDTVSGVVASLVARPYRLRDPRSGETVEAPRGDVLLFGGDTAYPVATRAEIEHRLVEPWNRVLSERDDGRARVLLGIPGNHDWNDGLDGFGRLFRRRDPSPAPGEPSRPPLALEGYVPVQDASYFALPLADGLDLLAPDRQLTHVDYRQRQYFRRLRSARPDRSLLVAQADPHRIWCRDNPPGREAGEALGLEDDELPHLFVAGDIHQYQRWREHGDTHVIGGGGGASLHGAARREGREGPPVEAEWPTPEQCAPLVPRCFARIASGTAGLFIHLVLAVATLVVAGLGAYVDDRTGIAVAGGVLGVAALVVAQRAWGKRSRLDALVAGMLVGVPSAAAVVATARLLPVLWARHDATLTVVTASLAVAVVGGIGVAAAIWYLAARGVDYSLAYAGLSHPGFKHFLRMRVRADGSGIDVWCLGKHDPCGDPDDLVLRVDAFHWPARRG